MGEQPAPSIWKRCPQLDDLLRKFYSDGLSFRQISERIMQQAHVLLSRNSLIGRSRRIGLVAPQQKAKAPSKEKAPRGARVAPYKPIVKSPIPEAALVLDFVPDPAQRRSIMSVKRSECRWPYGHPSDEDFFLCGGPVLEDRPYCLHHCQMAYLSKSELRAARAGPSWR